MITENSKEKSPKVCDNKSVGMLIWNDGKLLLIERKLFPFGFAPPAGHVDSHGSWDQAVRDEVNEEVGLIPKEIKLIAEGKKDNPCRRQGGSWHYWKIYEVRTEGELRRSEVETKQAGWYEKDRIAVLAKRTEKYLAHELSDEEWEESPGIEPVWYQWFKELGVLTKA